VLSQTFDFTGSSVSGSGCAPWGTGAGCQTAINKDDWCGNYQSDAPATSVTYDEAGLIPIIVASDKTIIGSGSAGVIKGKGLRIVGGSNIILQNIHITELNPQYVWGGDAITLEGSDMVWIDHVKVKRVFKGARKNLDSHLSNRLP
jgi:pectin lyase